ncbi:aminopeptidase P family protein [Candidatus Bipolaricaulota bacterium]|nr:aminopeptidase P family protein [Candidatus Bipolaricaulota bacterium]
MDYARRRARLWEEVRGRGLDAFLVINLEGSESPNLRYLSGFTGSFGILILAKESVLATDSRYTEQAQHQVRGLPVEEAKGRWLPWLVERLSALDLRKIGIGTYGTSLYTYRELCRLGEGMEFVPANGLVEGLRRVKSPEEIERIAAAARLTDEGLRWMLGQLKPGLTERDVALELEIWYRRHGADDVAFDLIVASGPASAMPHHRAGERRLEGGDIVLLDIGVRLDGYCSDLTRVVALGHASRELRDLYRLVLAANRAGLEAVQAGVSGQDADRAARAVIEAGGYGDRFGHGLGHGVGLEVHEAPRLAPTSDDVLAAGHVVTVEPGVYLPGRFGIRIEDLVAVHADGCEILSGFPKEELLVV